MRCAETRASQPNYLKHLDRFVPAMRPKAYRFVDEMRQIASSSAVPMTAPRSTKAPPCSTSVSPGRPDAIPLRKQQ